ncbi:hypothetical protein PanWU01x14_269990 [Parasponia andersonii]|uniref:Reverse transcriptase domain-containing protein n=1 Tax=Parasponia andersonii TaxID=3476 RepID=A0A2P5B5J6_PARAD|nr:hypothetical protein PanWU01x14_269990 [Parasponia andersonii]
MMAGVRPETKLWEKLLERECRTLEDFYRRVGRHLRLESSHENLQNTKKKGRKDATKDAVITNNNGNKKNKRNNEQLKENQPRPKRQEISRAPMRFNNHTELNAPINHIYAVTNQKERFRQPEPMKQDRTKCNPNKFCRYHNNIGYDTNNCFALKDEIERLIREGRLRQYTRQNDERREEDQQ